MLSRSYFNLVFHVPISTASLDIGIYFYDACSHRSYEKDKEFGLSSNEKNEWSRMPIAINQLTWIRIGFKELEHLSS